MGNIKKYMTKETAAIVAGIIAVAVGLTADGQADLLDAIIAIGAIALGAGRVTSTEE